MIEVLVHLPSPILELQHTPLSPQSAMSQGTCLDSLLPQSCCKAKLMQCCILDVFLKTISFPALGSDQTHSGESSETRVRQVLGIILAKEQMGSLHFFVANACNWSGCY